MKKEFTQFSMVEFNIFAKGLAEMGVAAKPETNREKVMAAFVKFMVTPAGVAALTEIGGLENLQRVRVVGEDQLPVEHTDQKLEFNLVAKIPASVLRERERKVKEAAEAEVRKVLAAKRMEQRIKQAAERAKEKERQDKIQREKRLRTEDSVDAFEAALRQDRLNRIEAARKAAAEVRKAKRAS